jgi:TonB family protein
MRKPRLLMLLFSPVMVAAQQTSAPTPDVIATYPVALHEQLSSSCELIQPVTLIQYKKYDALALAGATDEIYSPELRKGDFVTLSTVIAQKVAKSAKKSGFDVRVDAIEASGLKPVTMGSSCPDSEQAIADANHRRYEQRVDVQKRLHRVGFDVLPPVPIQQAQPESAANQQTAQSSGTPKVKEGTTVLMIVVGVEGKIHDVHVVRSLEVALDQKAIKAVRQWKFLPARMNGLPVPVQVEVEVNFHLH